MKSGLGLVGLGVCIIISFAIVSNAYKYRFRSQDRIIVTGLGEKEFTSDMIVWNGWIVERSANMADGYARLEAGKKKVEEFIRQRGIPDSSVIFMFVDTERNYEPIYGANGVYQGQRLSGYELRQRFTVESREVDLVESISREISSLIAQGVELNLLQPDYFYTKLDDLKLELIKMAASDARKRAERIAGESDVKLRSLGNSRMGVFQITGANTNEEFSAGGSFNTSSRNKKARITVRQEYIIR